MTPETDKYIGDQDEDDMTEGEIAMCEFARSLERRLIAHQTALDACHDAIRRYRDAKGRYHTQLACEHLLTLLPESKP